MDPTGLPGKIAIAVQYIALGRKGFTIDGQEREGRINYERGIAFSLAAFQEAQASIDPQVLVLVELAFLQQELFFCDEADTITQSSLTQAIQSFEDALRCLKTVEDGPLYRAAETTYPTGRKYRINGFPKDAVHIACNSHRTRLQNIQRAPGINMTEKNVLEQRLANMKTIQVAYLEKQKKVL